MARAVSIITGGGRGIGRAIALRSAQDTAVLVIGRTEVDLVDVCREISSTGGDAAYIVGDITDPATARHAVTLAHEKGWMVRDLVCNAGIGKSGALETFDAQTWKDIFDVNVNGAFHFIQACLPPMLEAKRGNVILVSSIAGLKGYAFNSAYVASKHALVGLARSMALEYGARGITTVAICPGFVESEMTDRVIHGVMQRHGIDENAARARVAKSNPQRRILPAEEVAEAVAFVCSGKVPSLSGNPMVLSGGE